MCYLGILVHQYSSLPPALRALMVQLVFHMLTYLSALRSFHVTKLWKCLPVVADQVVKVALWHEMPMALMLEDVRPAAAIQSRIT